MAWHLIPAPESPDLRVRADRTAAGERRAHAYGSELNGPGIASEIDRLMPELDQHGGGNAFCGIALACLLTLPFWVSVAVIGALLVGR